MAIEYETFKDGGLKYALLKLKAELTSLLAGKTNTTDQATDSTLGLVKLNPAESVDTNANGQLTVGGRLGQFPGGGLYYPPAASPEYMGANDLLISEATDLRVENVRVFALFGGVGITLKKSAAAGATTYEVSNTFANRFLAACCLNGYATLNQQTAETNIVKVTSVKFANGNDISVYSGATESNNNIIITTDASANPDATTTSIRVYGSMSFDTTAQIGQGVGTGGVTGQGKLLALGQGICSLMGNSLLVGNGMYNTQNRVGMIGFQHINTQQGAFLAGQGHDTTNGKISVAALGQWSDIGANTAFAVGNGKTNTNRSNIFEVTDDSGQTGLVLKSPNGTRWKVAVDDSGNLTTAAL
ncbi:MAG: hypothetical protein IJ113_06880 [Eggerthellaceae bacterium]|nr:hypothetical protein [Eggerthellaceae bacterium]MBQ9147775.1 hypothetical protein [Rikenellaceae bacterium]